MQRPLIPALLPPRLRPVRAGDGAGCWDVMYRAVHQGTHGVYGPAERNAWAPTPTPPPGFEARLLGQYTILATRRHVLGFMSLGRDAHLDFAYVDPRWMGRGIADRLYDRILHHARDQAMPVLTTEASILFRKFLERRGWRTLARQSVIRDGVAITNFRMQLACPTPH